MTQVTTDRMHFLSAYFRRKLHVELGLTLVGIGLAGLFLWLALRDIDMLSLISSLQMADNGYVMPFVVCLTLFYGLKVSRWRALMPANVPVRSMHLFAPMMLGFAANNLLPMRLGELVRLYYAGKLLNTPKALVLGTIVVEKLFDIVVIAGIFIAGLLYISISAISVDGDFMQMLSAVLAVLLTMVVIPLVLWSGRGKLRHLLTRFPLHWQDRIQKLSSDFAAGIEVVDRKDKFLLILLNSLLQWLLLTLCIYFSMMAISPDPVRFSTATTLLGLLVLGVSLPSAPAYIGTVEYAFVFGLGLFGLAAEKALAIAVFYHVLSVSLVLMVGVVCFLYCWLAPKSPGLVTND